MQPDRPGLHPGKDNDLTAELRLKGAPASRGYAIGPAFLFKRDIISIDDRKIEPAETEEQKDKFKKSIEQSNKELIKISTITHQKLGEEFSAIFDAQVMMLFDPEVTRLIHREIDQNLLTAEAATEKAYNLQIDLLRAAATDPYLAQRMADLEDVKFRILRNLQRGKLLSHVEDSSVIVSDNLTPADMILFSRQNIVGIALDFGGLTSHVALIARSLNIPLVIGLHKISASVKNGDELILDGIDGNVIARPSQPVLEKYLKKKEKFRKFIAIFETGISEPAVTLDGKKINVLANIEFRDEINDMQTCGAEGIGLYRTEHLFLSRGYFPSEDHQFKYYASLFSQAKDWPVTIRAFDVGGDKVLESSFHEMNPFLGWRGIRIMLDRPDIFKNQIRAILRAAIGRQVKLMFPMVHNLTQVHQIKDLMEEVYLELDRKEIPYQKVPVGVMIEVPSAVIMSEEIAREVEFFSLGTNDLTQYTLAVDRGNDIISSLYRELEPAVLRLINRTVLSGHQAGIPVSLCGELGSNILATPLLIGMGMDDISVVIRRVPEVKYLVKNLRMEDCIRLKDEILTLGTVGEVEARLKSWLTEHLPQFAGYI